jgi:hypothetical protein
VKSNSISDRPDLHISAAEVALRRRPRHLPKLAHPVGLIGVSGPVRCVDPPGPGLTGMQRGPQSRDARQRLGLHPGVALESPSKLALAEAALGGEGRNPKLSLSFDDQLDRAVHRGIKHRPMR